MNVSFPEKRISDVIKDLRKALKKHGDVHVMVSREYPEPYEGYRYIPKDKGDGYYPGDSIAL